jgi:diadenosine tetraphosphate (Ap4A) HIT family hydrolase
MSTEDAVAVPPHNVLTSCHVVVAPRRHVASFYELDVGEQSALWFMVGEIRKRIAASLKVDSFHIGFADGEHTHVHVVPLCSGDAVRLPDTIEWVNPDL